MDAVAVRARLREDFRNQFRGDLRLDDISRRLYSTDASLFQIEPLGVVAPRDEVDLGFIVRYAKENGLSLVPRGAGTGLAGESLGAGLVVDTSVYFRSILETGEARVRVQPGVVLRQLNAHLAETGRRFAPDPASRASCTIGGMLGTNASGGKCAIHGYTRDHVAALSVVWDDGSSERLDRLPISAAAPDLARTAEIRLGVKTLFDANAALIQASQPKTAFNRCGYNLHSSAGLAGPDLIDILVGSEGTLALFTEATLRTIPLAGGRAAAAFGFATIEGALHAARLARELWPAACDILDRRLLSLARARTPEAAAAIPPEAEAAILVEFEREVEADARDAVRTLIDTLQNVHHLALLAVPAYGDAAADRLWDVRDAALSSLYAIGRGSRPVAFVEDIGVAPDDLGDFVGRSREVLKRHEVSASFLIHAATGQVHLRPLLDLENPTDAAKLWPLAEELHCLAIDMGGTVSAQHGTGIARTPWVERQYGRLFPVLREVKQLFDPHGLFNPGKIVGLDPSRPAWPLRAAVLESAHESLSPSATDGPATSYKPFRRSLLHWQPGEMVQAVSACNGCGACRTEMPGQRMCPVFRVNHSEDSSPRAKANLFRDLLAGGLERLGDAAVRQVADLCVNCKMCGRECPGQADIPKLMLEAKAANHAARGLSRSDWLLARIDGLAALGGRFPLTANLILGRPVARWLLDKVFGLSRHRSLPRFAYRPFQSLARRRGLTKLESGRAGVAYFTDTVANVFDPSVAEATVAVLNHNGIPVYVPPKQRGTGAAALAQGDTDTARRRLIDNVRVLAECVRGGLTVVCSEPTAALHFRLDALGLADDPDVRLVAENAVELTAYLWDLHAAGRLKTDFQTFDFSIGHHVPCHIKALGNGVRGPSLLALIPGVRVNKIDVGCSGMAGAFGLKAKNYEMSLEIGRPMLDELARPDHLFGASECSACRMQMQEGTGKRSLHPVQYLALAYGLMPALESRLRHPPRKGLTW